MTKAYDFTALLDSLKADGLEVTEELAKKFIDKLFPWLTESAVLSESKVDDFLAVAYPIAHAKLKEAAEAINKAD